VIRIVEMRRDFVGPCDTSNVERVLGEFDADPPAARQIQGTMAFVFPDNERNGEPVWLDPEVRAWVRKAHERIPHLLYYLAPELDFGALFFAVAAFGGEGAWQVSRDGDQVGVVVDGEVALQLVDLLAGAAVFAELVADDWRPLVAAMVEPLDAIASEQLTDAVEAIVIAAAV
jgi:hypothetical protein